MTLRSAMAGDAWNCPHCGERILRSAATCPACQRHLRFDAVSVARPSPSTVCPLSVDGTIRHPGTEAAWEYSVLIEIHDERGELVARRVVGVGALRPGETRKFTLRVEVLVPEKSTLSAAS
ncbi:MAG TPA: FxLYD domain-containing protein [Methylomirabilota bacterium]|jgi:hypothetical protein|nr:FxLYD domain-containing protein [Methylomirabilota bacterium]